MDDRRGNSRSHLATGKTADYATMRRATQRSCEAEIDLPVTCVWEYIDR